MSVTPKISVLIPIYNVKKYLSACLDSVLSQTLENMEIICINDGSTDGCREILAEYAERDLRIKVIDKLNSGYGASMNMGLKAATGEYIGIVESDDEIRSDFYEKLYKAAKDNELDIAKGECTFNWPTEGYKYAYHASYIQKYFERVIGKDRLWLRCQFFMNIWTGIYRREFLENYSILFNETPGASYQDNGFWMQCMIFAERVMFTDENGYLYRQDNEAASVKDVKKVYAMSDEYEWLANHLEGRITNKEMNVINTFRLIRAYWNLFRIDDSMKREFCDRLISDYEKYGDVFSTNLLWQERFYQIKEDADGFCKKIIETKQHVEAEIDRAKSIIIYGAGNRGQKLFRLFCDKGFVRKLQCFVETLEPVGAKVGTVPVKQINDSSIDWDNALVVISPADGSKMAKEMVKNCDGILQIRFLGSDSFLDFYYMLT